MRETPPPPPCTSVCSGRSARMLADSEPHDPSAERRSARHPSWPAPAARPLGPAPWHGAATASSGATVPVCKSRCHRGSVGTSAGLWACASFRQDTSLSTDDRSRDNPRVICVTIKQSYNRVRVVSDSGSNFGTCPTVPESEGCRCPYLPLATSKVGLRAGNLGASDCH